MAVLALIFLLLLGGCSQPEPAAQVNGEDITMEELEEQVAMLKASIEASGLSLSMEENEEYLELLRGEALKMMVRERILMQDLKKNDITLDEEAAQEYVGMLKELYGEETYNSILASNGTDEKQFIRDFAYNQALQKLYTQVTTEVTVSDGEVRNLFDADPDSYVQGSASHILLKVDWTTASDEEKNEKLALARELIGRLRRTLPWLKLLVALCPLLGLLGTVTGMIAVFDSLAMTETSQARAMADGVARATLPTLTGMAVAVVGLMFTSRLEQIIRREDQRLHDRLARAVEDPDA